MSGQNHPRGVPKDPGGAIDEDTQARWGATCVGIRQQEGMAKVDQLPAPPRSQRSGKEPGEGGCVRERRAPHLGSRTSKELFIYHHVWVVEGHQNRTELAKGQEFRIQVSLTSRLKGRGRGAG